VTYLRICFRMNQDRKQKILTVAAEAVSEWEQKLAATDWKVEKDSVSLLIAPTMTSNVNKI
jgi:hypothetical protein